MDLGTIQLTSQQWMHSVAFFILFIISVFQPVLKGSEVYTGLNTEF